jgi:hypothetical protein
MLIYPVMEATKAMLFQACQELHTCELNLTSAAGKVVKTYCSWVEQMKANQESVLSVWEMGNWKVHKNENFLGSDF